MNRLRVPRSLTKLLLDFLGGLLFLGCFFGAIYIATQNDQRAAIQDALDARAASETRLQRAARGICNDIPAAPGRRYEPNWLADGRMQCLAIVTEEVIQ